jgi:hypothetical protein
LAVAANGVAMLLAGRAWYADGAGRIAAIFIVRNPEKLRRLAQTDASTFR